MNVTINIVELATELADQDLESHFGGNRWVEAGDDELVYTEEAQDLFDDYYDYYYSVIEKLQIKS